MNPLNKKTNSDQWPSLPGLRIGSINICSLPNKITEISSILHNSGSFLHIFGVSESRCLNIHKKQVEVNNYTNEHIFSNSNSNKNLS